MINENLINNNNNKTSKEYFIDSSHTKITIQQSTTNLFVNCNNKMNIIATSHEEELNVAITTTSTSTTSSNIISPSSTTSKLMANCLNNYDISNKENLNNNYFDEESEPMDIDPQTPLPTRYINHTINNNSNLGDDLNKTPNSMNHQKLEQISPSSKFKSPTQSGPKIVKSIKHNGCSNALSPRSLIGSAKSTTQRINFDEDDLSSVDPFKTISKLSSDSLSSSSTSSINNNNNNAGSENCFDNPFQIRKQIPRSPSPPNDQRHQQLQKDNQFNQNNNKSSADQNNDEWETHKKRSSNKFNNNIMPSNSNNNIQQPKQTPTTSITINTNDINCQQSNSHSPNTISSAVSSSTDISGAISQPVSPHRNNLIESNNNRGKQQTNGSCSSSSVVSNTTSTSSMGGSGGITSSDDNNEIVKNETELTLTITEHGTAIQSADIFDTPKHNNTNHFHVNNNRRSITNFESNIDNNNIDNQFVDSSKLDGLLNSNCDQNQQEILININGSTPPQNPTEAIIFDSIFSNDTEFQSFLDLLEKKEVNDSIRKSPKFSEFARKSLYLQFDPIAQSKSLSPDKLSRLSVIRDKKEAIKSFLSGIREDGEQEQQHSISTNVSSSVRKSLATNLDSIEEKQDQDSSANELTVFNNNNNNNEIKETKQNNDMSEQTIDSNSNNFLKNLEKHVNNANNDYLNDYENNTDNNNHNDEQENLDCLTLNSQHKQQIVEKDEFQLNGLQLNNNKTSNISNENLVNLDINNSDKPHNDAREENNLDGIDQLSLSNKNQKDDDGEELLQDQIFSSKPFKPRPPINSNTIKKEPKLSASAINNSTKASNAVSSSNGFSNFHEDESNNLMNELNELREREKAHLERISVLEEENNKFKLVAVEFDGMFHQMIKEKDESETKLKNEIIELTKERDHLQEDVVGVERAFDDLHRRFDKLKHKVEEFKKNEENLHKAIETHKQQLEKEKLKYSTLKKHAEEKLEFANNEIDKLRKSTGIELSTLKAELRKAEIKISSLELSVQQKDQENTQLTNLLEDLLSKVKPNN